MIGERLGNEFEILELLRQSSFGNTYRARQPSLDRDVAVRVLDPRAISEASLGRFLADAERLKGMHHPNVVQVYSIGWDQKTPYVVTELLAGHPLSQTASELPAPARLHVLIQVAEGLSAMHAAGIVHRGLSPSSVLLTETTVKISDLGLSGRLGQMTHDTQERLGSAAGEYLSPEQILGSDITPASDMFAFGVMLYEAITGRHPFQAGHPMALLNNILRQVPPPPDSRNRPGLKNLGNPATDRLDALVLRCLEKRPERRFGSMTGVRDELRELERRLLTGEGSTVVAPRVPNPYGTRVMIRAREDFFGRREEAQRIYARLDADPPESIAILGDHKIGKSSLLNYIYMRGNRERYLRDPQKMFMVFLDFQRDTAWTIELFAKMLLETISLETDHRFDTSDCSHDLQGIRRIVEQIHKDGYRLTLILDEFERITSNPQFPAEFFAFLRSLAQHYNVAYLTSSARDLQHLCHDRSICDSPFFNIFSSLRLGPLRAEEARKLICIPSERAGYSLDAYRDEILGLAGELPFFLQLACSLAFDSLSEGKPPDFQKIEKRFRQDAEPHFRVIWEACDEVERSILKAVGAGKRVEPSRQHGLDDLSARGYIQVDPSGPRLFAAPFRDFVARMAAPEIPVAAATARRTGGRKLAGAVGALILAVAALVVYTVQTSTHSARRTAGPDIGMSPPNGETRGRAVSVPSPSSTVMPSYAHSYALVIGAGAYEHGWPTLPNVASDVQEVAGVLGEQGFQVEKVMDPDQEHLRGAFQDFIARRGLGEHDRLLFYFAGHGYTHHQSYGEDMGYIVPTDAPDPAKDLSGFLAKAISMDQIATYARAIQSRHALFVFDACFAGSIFTQSRSAPGYIAFKMDSPVRQFITSGDANETVPDRSIFRREFVAGLRGEADQNGDGYVTGSELGEFLLEKVVQYSSGAQHPRQGKLRDPNLDKGDFVFMLHPRASVDSLSTRP
jgi:tRNA A-37 threonylcarbamoyl transferase component Bud32